MFVPALVRSFGTGWDKNGRFCLFLFQFARAQVEHAGTNIGVFGQFSSKCAIYRLKVRSKVTSAIASEITRVPIPFKGYARSVCGKALPFRRADQLAGYDRFPSQLEAQPQIVSGPNGKAQPFRTPSAASRGCASPVSGDGFW
jgi:hypothetical protein